MRRGDIDRHIAGDHSFAETEKMTPPLHFRRIVHSSMLVLSLVLPCAALAEVKNIGAGELAGLMNGDATLVDIRTPGEWTDTGIVENSHLMTFFDERGQYDALKWLSELEQVSPPGNPIILICRTGSRTRLVAEWLDRGGNYSTIYNVQRGIAEWLQMGFPTVAP